MREEGALWLGSIAVAFRAARHRKFTVNCQWMLRNSTIMFFILFFVAYDLATAAELAPAEQVATVGVWVCWVVPLSLVEWWIRRGSPSRRLAPG